MNMMQPYARAPDLIECAITDGTFTTLCKALDAADLTHMLKGSGPYTLFAPTDAAFDALPDGKLAQWMAPENRAELVGVLKYHVLPGRSWADDVADMTKARMMQGDSVRIQMEADRCTVNGAHFVGTQITAGNGVIHAIDTVLSAPGTDRPGRRR